MGFWVIVILKAAVYRWAGRDHMDWTSSMEATVAVYTRALPNNIPVDYFKSSNKNKQICPHTNTHTPHTNRHIFPHALVCTHKHINVKINRNLPKAR